MVLRKMSTLFYFGMAILCIQTPAWAEMLEVVVSDEEGKTRCHSFW